MRTIIIALLALSVAAPAGAKPWSAICSNLAGMRADDTGGQASFIEDAVKGASWTYAWNTATKKATLTLPASHASDGKAHTQDGTVSTHRGGFFVIVSTLPGAVWTHALYPETGQVLAVQSTTKAGTRLAGRMLVGTCAMGG